MSRPTDGFGPPDVEAEGSREKVREGAAGSSSGRSPTSSNTYVFPIRSVYQREQAQQAREDTKHLRPSPVSPSLALGLTDAIFTSPPPTRPQGLQRASSDNLHDTIHEMLEHRGDLAPNRTMTSMSFIPKTSSSRGSLPSPTFSVSSSLPNVSAESPPIFHDIQRPSFSARPTAVRVPTVTTSSSGTGEGARASSSSLEITKDSNELGVSISPMTSLSQDPTSDSSPRKTSATTLASSDPVTPASGSAGNSSEPSPKPQVKADTATAGPEIADADGLKSPVTRLEPNEEGVPSLVNDFMDIIRLDGAVHVPSPSSNDNSGRSGRSTLHQPQVPPSAVSRIASTMIPNSSNLGPSIVRHDQSASGSTPSMSLNGNRNRAAQAQAMREQKEHSVLDFINEQARTVQISDPNEASPSTSPVSDSDMPQSEHCSSSQEDFHIYAPKAERWNEGQTKTESIHTSPSSELRRSDNATTSGSRTTNTGTNTGTGTGSGTASGSRLDSALATSSDLDSPEPVVTFRFQHVQRDDGHHVITGREGAIVRCEDEPITTPGAIQSFGVLMVLEWDYESGNLIVRQVSEVSGKVDDLWLM